MEFHTLGPEIPQHICGLCVLRVSVPDVQPPNPPQLCPVRRHFNAEYFRTQHAFRVWAERCSPSFTVFSTTVSFPKERWMGTRTPEAALWRGAKQGFFWPKGSIRLYPLSSTSSGVMKACQERAQQNGSVPKNPGKASRIRSSLVVAVSSARFKLPHRHGSVHVGCKNTLEVCRSAFHCRIRSRLSRTPIAKPWTLQYSFA